MKKILLSTGVFFRCSKDINESIDFASNFDVDGIELSFIFFDEMLSCNLSEDSLNILKKWNYNTIHAPGSHKDLWRDEEKFQKYLETLKSLADTINTKKITIHADHVGDWNFIINNLKDYQICVENVRPKDNFDDDQLMDLLKKYPQLNITFDTAHAMDFSIEEYCYFFNNCKSRINNIHISLTHNGRFHNFSHNCDNEIKKNSLKILSDLDTTFVLEAGLRDGFDFDLVNNEIKFIKNL